MNKHARKLGFASAFALALAVVTGAPLAMAQKGPAAPKAPKGAPPPAPPPAPPTAPVPEPAPAASAAPAWEPANTAAAQPPPPPLEPPKAVEPKRDEHDPTEDPSKRYYAVGLRYRATIIPKALLNIFVKEGATIVSHSIGAEIDIRKDSFSIIPALSYTEYGTGDILFQSAAAGTNENFVGNYSVVNSSMKAMYATVDLLWSARIAKGFDFEYGAGVGLGFVFGDLVTNWVYEDPNGPIAASTGQHYSRCAVVGRAGCNSTDHQNATTAKVGGYTESSWLNGGAKPSIFPHISIPQIGLRVKPVKEFEGRFGLGFSLTGFWFGFSGNYGLPSSDKTEQKKAE